jgi:hypothetical protein
VVAVYRQVLDPVAHSLGWSSLVAALPLLVLFVLLGMLRVSAWVASLVSLALALVNRNRGVHHAGWTGATGWDRRCRVWRVPDPVDRHQRDLDRLPERVAEPDARAE